MWRYKAVILLLSAILLSCSSSKIAVRNDFNMVLTQVLETSDILNGATVGLSIYDAKSGHKLYGYNENNRCIPASNIKILTLYGAKHFLGDSLPIFKYVRTDSTITLWGCGDGSFLKNDLPEGAIIQRLKALIHNRKVYLSRDHANLKPFGKGWMWDDYNDGYQAELSTFPIHGNVISFFGHGGAITEIIPNVPFVTTVSEPKYKGIQRDREQNRFVIGAVEQNTDWRTEIPMYDAEEISVRILERYIGTHISDTTMSIPIKGVKMVYSSPIDTVLKLMMDNSDNMLAEQTLLQVGMVLDDTLNSRYAIDTIQKTLFSDLRANMRWVDGSGLSRYNLISPNDLVSILIRLFSELGQEMTFDLMPKTELKLNLSGQFNQAGSSQFYLKTGSMSGVYNVSGYLSKPSGNIYAISLMTNGTVVPTSRVRREVDQLLQLIDTHVH